MAYLLPSFSYDIWRTRPVFAALCLLVLLRSVNARGCPSSYFSRLCRSRDFSITNPHLPESLGNRSSCGLVVKPDGHYQSFPIEVSSEPCRGIEYTFPNGSFVGKYTRKCDYDLYKVTGTPNEDQEGSTPYWSTFSDESDPSYIAIGLCKGGKLVGRYAEIAAPLNDRDIRDLKYIYGININPDGIDACLEEADSCV